jgi:hypothetical protein
MVAVNAPIDCCIKGATPKFFGRGSNGVDGADDVIHQLVEVERAAVGKFSFGERPNAFIGIKPHFLLPDVVEVQDIVETQVLRLRTDRNSGNHGDFVPATLAMTLNRGRALARPSLSDQRRQQKARFIGKN